MNSIQDISGASLTYFVFFCTGRNQAIFQVQNHVFLRPIIMQLLGLFKPPKLTSLEPSQFCSPV